MSASRINRVQVQKSASATQTETLRAIATHGHEPATPAGAVPVCMLAPMADAEDGEEPPFFPIADALFPANDWIDFDETSEATSCAA